MEGRGFMNALVLPPPPKFHKGDNYTRWVSRMECYLQMAPLQHRTAIFLTCLDDPVFDVVASLGLTSQTELSVAIACVKAEFDPVRDVSIDRQTFRRRQQRPGETVDEFLRALRSLVTFAFPKSNDTDSILLEQFVDGMRNIEVRKAFLTEEPETLDEARKVARLEEMISDAVNLSPFNDMSPGVKQFRDANTQTDAYRGNYNSKGGSNQRRFKNYHKTPNRPHF